MEIPGVPTSIVTTVLVLLALAVVLYLVILFNNLIRLRVNIDKAWANIDVLLKQRHDEVPNLIAVVKGVKNFERQVLEQVTAARSASLAAGTVREKAGADKGLDSALGRLFAVAEKYPTLKAQENFLQLQKRLSEIEDMIADRRTFYNDSTAAYNTRIAQFPDLMMASLLGYRPRELFQATAGEKEVVKAGL